VAAHCRRHFLQPAIPQSLHSLEEDDDLHAYWFTMRVGAHWLAKTSLDSLNLRKKTAAKIETANEMFFFIVLI